MHIHMFVLLLSVHVHVRIKDIPGELNQLMSVSAPLDLLWSNQSTLRRPLGGLKNRSHGKAISNKRHVLIYQCLMSSLSRLTCTTMLCKSRQRPGSTHVRMCAHVGQFFDLKIMKHGISTSRIVWYLTISLSYRHTKLLVL